MMLKSFSPALSSPSSASRSSAMQPTSSSSFSFFFLPRGQAQAYEQILPGLLSPGKGRHQDPLTKSSLSSPSASTLAPAGKHTTPLPAESHTKGTPPRGQPPASSPLALGSSRTPPASGLHSLVFLLDSTSTTTDSPLTRPWGSSHGSQPRPGSSEHSTLPGWLLKFKQLWSVPVCPLGYLPPPCHTACKKGPWYWLSCCAPSQQCLLPGRAWVRVKKEWHCPGPKARLLGATAGTVCVLGGGLIP